MLKRDLTKWPGFLLLVICLYTNLYVYNLYEAAVYSYSNSPVSSQTYDPGGRQIGDVTSKAGIVSKAGETTSQLQLIISPRSCQEEGVILVHSYSGEDRLRLAQREAWAPAYLNNLGFKRIFVLFQAERANYRQIQAEAEAHDDILLVNLRESYYRLAEKHVIGLSWAVSKCRNLQEIVKMDDDIYVNLPQFLSAARRNIPAGSSLWMLGLLQVELTVRREPDSKWFLPRQTFPSHTFPNFLSGWAYFTNKETVIVILTKILNCHRKEIFASLCSPEWLGSVFWIDDVWLTGLVAGQLGVDRYSLNSYYTVYSDQLSCCLDKGISCPYLVAPVQAENPQLIVKAASRAKLCAVCTNFRTPKCNNCTHPGRENCEQCKDVITSENCTACTAADMSLASDSSDVLTSSLADEHLCRANCQKMPRLEIENMCRPRTSSKPVVTIEVI